MKKISGAKIIVFTFTFLIIIGTILFSLPISTADGTRAPFLTAIFTATSAVCVTGLVVVDTATYWSTFGQVIIMILIQLGGLGLMTFATLFALFLGKRIGLQERLVLQESLNQIKLQGIVKLIYVIILVTVIAEGIGAILLAYKWSELIGWKQSLYYGVFHSISAFNNAGFDLFGTLTGEFSGLTSFQTDPIIPLLIASLFILGGLGFIVILEIIEKKSLFKLSLHSKIVLSVTGLLIVIGTLGIYLLEYSNPETMEGLSQWERFLTAFFQGVTPRTAGFSTVDISSLTVATQFLIILLMFIGASPGSTGGGVKTTTFAGVIIAIKSALLGKKDVEIFKKRIPQVIVGKMLAVVGLALTWVFFATMILIITEKADFFITLFEVVSALGTVGLSIGLTPELSPVGRVVIMITMFLGRIGPLTVAIAITERARKPHNIKYPEEKIIVG
ncbi:MAG: ATP synthase subunit J [Peptococcaceae bacterium BICA1-8]|nr:MAG: ATP synthase subunit J [Peptococcaceae bacterium BICA1-8]